MRTIFFFIFVFVATVSLFFAFGCSAQGKLFGQPITETKRTPVGDILSKPEQFENKTVKVEGRITDECPAGGWFFLKDETGLIYVNLHPMQFAIPQIRGHEVIAQGTVRKEGPQVEIIGEGVQIK
jgi:uncharacterized protein YdeI (BOF family)